MMRFALVALLLCVVGCDRVSDLVESVTGKSETKRKRAARETEESEEDDVSARDVCLALKEEEIGVQCTKATPGGLGAAAWEKYELNLSEPANEKCQILSFRKRADYDATEEAFDRAATIAGPHRYGSSDKLIYVQCNKGLPRPKSLRVEKVIKRL